MRGLLTAIVILIVLNALGIAGFAGWLYMDGRLSRARVDRVVEMFSLTLAEEAEKIAQEDAQVADATAKAKEIEYIERVALGPQTMADRVAAEQADDDRATARAHRLEKEIKALRQMLQNAEGLLASQTTALEKQRKELDEVLAKAGDEAGDEDFKLAVEWFEQLSPKLSKQMFQQMMTQQRTDEVVEYLAAMDSRKASAILGEFKQEFEVPQATELIDQLRQRGVQMVSAGGPVANIGTN